MPKEQNLSVPIAIVVAGAMVAGALFFAGRGAEPTAQVPVDTTGGNTVNTFVPVTSADHILGNPDAPVKVIEYADLECPYCKTFNTTMHQVMDYYGASGKVAWVYRPFPLSSIHSKAPKEAEAAECAADQGGDTSFFKYIDRVYEVTPGNNGLDLAQLPIIANDIGINVDTFNQCLSSNKYQKRVQDSYAEAIAAGGQGTPFTLIMVGTDSVVLNDAQQYDSMRAVIDTVLSGLPGGAATTTTQ